MNVIKSVIGSTLMVVGTLTLSQHAIADQQNSLRIAEFTHPSVERVKINYEVDDSLGRAWVILELEEDNDEENFYFKRVVVPGMSFDADKGHVVIEKNGRNTVCAELEHGFVFGIPYQRFSETGKCPINITTETVEVDNGFSLDYRQVHVATLTVERENLVYY